MTIKAALLTKNQSDSYEGCGCGTAEQTGTPVYWQIKNPSAGDTDQLVYRDGGILSIPVRVDVNPNTSQIRDTYSSKLSLGNSSDAPIRATVGPISDSHENPGGGN